MKTMSINAKKINTKEQNIHSRMTRVKSKTL